MRYWGIAKQHKRVATKGFRDASGGRWLTDRYQGSQWTCSKNNNGHQREIGVLGYADFLPCKPTISKVSIQGQNRVSTIRNGLAFFFSEKATGLILSVICAPVNYAIRFSVTPSGMAPPRRLERLYKPTPLAGLPFSPPSSSFSSISLIAIADRTPFPCTTGSQRMRCAMPVVSLFAPLHRRSYNRSICP